MYQGANRIALQSQRLITEAVFRLMEHKDFSRITIKELCTEAMVSRQTFYSLFDSKEEILTLQLDILFSEFIEKYIAGKREFSIRSLCESMLDYLRCQKHFVQIMLQSRLDYVVQERIEHYLSTLDNLLTPEKRLHHDYAIAFLAGALMSTISRAVKNNDLDNGSMISDIIEEIITGRYFSV